MSKNKLLSLLLGIALLITGIFSYWNHERLTTNNNFITAQNDTLTRKFNKQDSTYTYAKTIFNGTQKDLELLKKDYAELYKKAKNPKVQTVLVTNTETRIDTVVKQVEITRDTAGYEVRKSTIKVPEYTAHITSYKDSIHLALKAYSRLTLSVGKDGKIEATPSSKYLTITDIQGYNKVEPKKKYHKWIWFAVGVVAGGYTTYKITK